MKVIRIILALYILYLAVYPCSDSKTCLDERKTGIALIDQRNHDHNSSERDLCTPFCTCVCCTAHIKLSPLSDIDFASVIHNTKVTIPYIEKQVLSSSDHIWQPPRI